MTCITPRAFALETIALLNPDSCHAIADASEAGTPLRAATAAMSAEVTRPVDAYGAACGTRVVAGAGCDAPAGAGEPVGSFRTVPESRIPLGSSSFIAATALIGTRAVTAIAERESPGRTV